MTVLPTETLLRLPERGPRGLPDILGMAQRGDWRMRALSWSAAGRIARAENLPLRALRWAARLVPGQRERFPSAGHQGKYVRHFIVNGLVDRSWIVRTAAALALGECRSPAMIDALRRLLTGPYRAERIAAAAALVCCGDNSGPSRAELLEGALPAPARIGDATRSIDFLETLAACHLQVLAEWPRFVDRTGNRPLDRAASRSGSRTDVGGGPVGDVADVADVAAGSTAASWAAFLAGPVPEERYDGPEAEIDRYDADGETTYLLAKPFTSINRIQNVRLLHSFLVAAEHLRLPQHGRVLDLGGGSAWVSELLARLGYRPFTLDVSSPLLRIGQKRFAREGLTARFVAADMTRLPVATASMDAVVVIDALHHVPDAPAVFREAHRVLVDGGRFVLAEPGEGHSETAKSQGEMREHGVQEREIHLFEAIDYGRQAGFDDIRVVPHYVPGVTMAPGEVTRAMTTAQDQWVIEKDDLSTPFSQFVLQSMVDHPILVFGKGRRPIDSRAPQTLRADITPRLTRVGVHVDGRVTLRNVGDTIWLGGSDGAGYVRLGIQLLDADRHLLNMEFSRIVLPRNVAPGEGLEVDVALTLPDAAAPYVLKIDLVDEGVCWFEDVGSRAGYEKV